MRLFIVGLGLLFSVAAFGSQPMPTREGIFNTRTRQWMSLEQVAADLDQRSVVVLGEQHVTRENLNDPESILHHANQLRWLQAVNVMALGRGLRALLGMEFLSYPTQSDVGIFLNGLMSEEDFLKAAGWGANPFEPYKKLMLESMAAGGGGTVALNIPPSVARTVSQRGPDALSEDQKRYLPPIWERGSAEYFERFEDAMGGHVSKEKLENYFWAQSLWDDTMAWRASYASGSSGPLTIVVGEFHVEFGHGLPARLPHYGVSDVRTMIQVAVDAGADFDQVVAPDSKYGERADYIWVFARN